MQVAFDLHEFLLHQRENIGVAERRQRLPEFLPDTARGAQAKAVVGRDERTRHHVSHAAFLHTQQGVGVIYGNHEGGVDEAATMDERGVGYSPSRRSCRSCVMLPADGTAWNDAMIPARTLAATLAAQADQGYFVGLRLPSSSGPGRRPLTAKTGVRVP